MPCNKQRGAGREHKRLPHLQAGLQLNLCLQQRWACSLGSNLIVQLFNLQCRLRFGCRRLTLNKPGVLVGASCRICQ